MVNQSPKFLTETIKSEYSKSISSYEQKLLVLQKVKNG